MATFKIGDKKKIVHFGASGMNDFTITKNVVRKKLYVQRHHKDLNTNDPARAGYLSMFILWNKKSVGSSIRDYRRRLGIYNRTGKFPVNI